VNDDVELHGAACPWLNPGEVMKRNCRFRHHVWVGWRGLLRLTDDYNDQKLLADIAKTWRVELITLEALALASGTVVWWPACRHWKPPK
jgi:hypothetical protein